MSIANQEVVGQTRTQDQSINQLIKWGDHLSVGHPEIDAQHKEIYEFGAEIYVSWRVGIRVGELRIATDRLLTILRAHFVYEERLLAGIGYGDLKQHVAEQRSMLNELKGMRDHFETLSDDDDSPGGVGAVPELVGNAVYPGLFPQPRDDQRHELQSIPHGWPRSRTTSGGRRLIQLA